jgi:hypothetical protein
VIWRRNGQASDRPTRPPRVYQLPDPQLRAYDRGLGTLSVEGEFKGYLASVVGRVGFLWPWFVVVWQDGSKEWSFEDYGPGWWTVRELDAGYFDHFGPSIRSERTILGRRCESTRPGPPIVYEFAWLPAAEAARKWQELGLKDSDF